MNVNVTPEQAKTPAAAPFQVRRLGASLGAEILGVDLKAPMDDDAFAAFEAALIEHKVLAVRDQFLTTEQHVAFSRRFGELEVHPMRPQGQFPEILVLDNHKDNPVLSTDVWHSDTTFRKNPTKYTILRCEIMPEFGGDTLWANMEAAYDGLSDTFQAMISGLRAVHDFQNFRVLFTNSDEDRPSCAAWRRCSPIRRIRWCAPIRSPAERASTSTRNSPCASKAWSRRRAARILDVLFEQAQVPEYQFRLRWTPGTIVFWDNRSTQHYAANDYYPQRRRMERTAVVGDVPV